MTANGFVQIALYCVVVTLLVKPFGYYMTRVFNGERTFLSPLLRPFERVIYTVSGVNEREEQGWLAYGLAMLTFSLMGFLALYALQRLQAFYRSTRSISTRSAPISPSTRRSASSPIPIGRPTRPKRS